MDTKNNIITIPKEELYKMISFNIENIYHLSYRQKFCEHFSWAIPSIESILELKKYIGKRKVIELGAGLGLWTYLLSVEGVDIVGTDNGSWNYPFMKFCQIEILDYKLALKKYAEREILLTIWPPLNSAYSDDMLNKFKGDVLIYIGEPFRGATASDKFFKIVQQEWKLIKQIGIPRWLASPSDKIEDESPYSLDFGILDRIYIYQRI